MSGSELVGQDPFWEKNYDIAIIKMQFNTIVHDYF